MNRVKTIVIFLFLVLFVFSGNKMNAQDKPDNVLFIFIDDLNTQLNCYGNKTVISPNIDKLAGNSALFTHAYCQWSVCGPSRASILSGQMPAQTGIRNLKTQLRDASPNIVTLPQYFKNRGYITAAVGKIFDPRNVDSGHDTKSWSLPYSISYKYPEKYGPFVKGQYRVTKNTSTEMGPEGVGDDGYLDGQICIDALNKLENFASSPEKPFFLAVGFKKPHIPFIAPKKYWDLYNRDSLKLAPFQRHATGSPDFVYFKPEPSHYDDIPEMWTYDDVEYGNGILPPETQRRLIHGYYACISYVDEQVGKLMNKLTELNLNENTIIVLLGDHGYHLGDHNQWGKHTQFENATHAPLIIHNPDFEKTRCNSPVNFLDIYPTLTNLVFHEQPEHLTGENLTPLLKGGKMAEKPAVTEYRSSGHSSYSFRTERYRLTLWNKSANNRPDIEKWNKNNIYTAELYDYKTDELETESFYDSASYKEIVDSILVKSGHWWNMQNSKINSGATGAAIREYQNSPIQNPVKEYIQLPQQYGKVDMKIYDLRGNLIMQKKNQSNSVYVGNLITGQYLVLLEWEKTDEVLDFRMVKI